MDPITLAIAALAMVATKATEKVGEKAGEKLSDGVIVAAKRWLRGLRQHAPDTVKRLEAVSDPSVIDVEILEDVKQVSAQQPDVQATMEATAAAVVMDQSSFQNLTKLAEKIGVVNLGTVENQTINQNF